MFCKPEVKLILEREGREGEWQSRDQTRYSGDMERGLSGPPGLDTYLQDMHYN